MAAAAEQHKDSIAKSSLELNGTVETKSTVGQVKGMSIQNSQSLKPARFGPKSTKESQAKSDFLIPIENSEYSNGLQPGDKLLN